MNAGAFAKQFWLFLCFAGGVLTSSGSPAIIGYVADVNLTNDGGGLTSLGFQTRPGFQYEVKSANDLSVWGPHSSHYGFGQAVSMIVKNTPPPASGGGSSGTAFYSYHSAYFFIHAFSNGKSLVSFTVAGERLKVTLAEDFSTVVSLPLFVTNYLVDIPEPANPSNTVTVSYSVSASVMGGVWLPEYDDPEYGTSSLTQPQLDELSILTDRVAQVRADMLVVLNNTGNSPPSVPPPSSNTSNAREFFLVEEHSIDSDGDGIPDSIEFAFWNSSAFLSDTDGDGVPDAWDAYPMDAFAWQFVAGDPNDTTAPTIYLTTPVGAIAN